MTASVLSLGGLPARGAEPARVAVLEFESASADPQYAHLGKGLQAMVTTDLAQVASLQLVERDRLEEIEVELELTASGRVDPQTAAKIGKLAGAQHLLAGTVTVVGTQMRIDARLFEVTTGNVLRAEKIEGGTDAFFELEKALVQLLVGATGVKLEPKERAKVTKVHTADFKAFQKFSDGVGAFDEKRYDDAIKSLREASALDTDFKLAELTLTEYEDLLSKLKSRVALIKATDIQRKEQQLSALAKEEQAVVDKLWAIVADKSPANRIERLTAIFRLAAGFGGEDAEGLYEWRRFQDRFALQRTADALAREYWSEALAVWPQVQLLITPDSPNTAHIPWVAKDYEKKEKEWKDRYLGAGDEQRHRRRLMDDLKQGYSRKFARRLHLDSAKEATMLATLLEKLQGLQGVEPVHVHNLMREVGLRFRQSGQIDESTKWLVKASQATDEEMRVRFVTSDVERNRDAKAAIQKAAKGSALAELLMLRDLSHDQKDLELFSSVPLAPRGRRYLTVVRELDGDTEHPTLVRGTPAWLLGDRTTLLTGRRDTKWSTDALRYYQHRAKDGWPATVLLGGDRRKALELSATLQYRPAADFWAPNLSTDKATLEETGFPQARPRAAFLVGLVDVDVPMQRDEATQKNVLVRPMRGYAVVVGGESLEVMALTEEARERAANDKRDAHNHAARRFAWRSLAQTGMRPGDVLEVTVALKGRTLKASAGGASVQATLPDEPEDGFFGVSFEGQGYLALEDLKVK